MTDEDLLWAFVERGGGRVGDWFRDQGLMVEALTTRVFLADGDLNLSCFDDRACRILRGMVDCARRKGHMQIGRRHMVQSLLLEDGEFARRLKQQGRDSEQLGDLLFVAMESGVATASPVQGRAHELTSGLLQALCVADVEAKSGALIGELDLVMACLRGGGGEVGQFLVQQGVRLSRLLTSDGR